MSPFVAVFESDQLQTPAKTANIFRMFSMRVEVCFLLWSCDTVRSQQTFPRHGCETTAWKVLSPHAKVSHLLLIRECLH